MKNKFKSLFRFLHLEKPASFAWNLPKRLFKPISHSRSRFHKERHEHHKLYNPNPGLVENQDELNELVENGILIKKDFFSQKEIQDLRDTHIPTLESIESGNYEGPHYYTRSKATGRYRLYIDDLDEYAHDLDRRFVEDNYIKIMMQGCLSEKFSQYGAYIEYVSDPNDRSVSDRELTTFYHTDHWMKRFKAFVYLTDVGEENAPFVYVMGSHKYDLWRREHEYSIWYNNNKRPDLQITSNEVKRIIKDYGYKEKVCTGKAGTLIFAETTGLHRATRLKSGKRVHLLNQFRLLGGIGKSRRN